MGTNSALFVDVNSEMVGKKRMPEMIAKTYEHQDLEIVCPFAQTTVADTWHKHSTVDWCKTRGQELSVFSLFFGIY